MKNRIITISREFGSGGRTIGKKVAEKLGIPCYDSELIEKVASESGFNANYIKDAGEYAPGGFLCRHSPIAPPDPIMRIICGQSSIRSLQSWQRRGPVSL